MRRWMNLFLRENMLETYDKVLTFFAAPSKEYAKEICATETFPMQQDLLNMLYYMVDLYRTNRLLYNQTISQRMSVTWSEVFDCYTDMCDLAKRFDNAECLLNMDSYAQSAAEIKKICTYYAQMQKRISQLEKNLGIDRFLDRIGEETFEILNAILKKYHDKLNQVTTLHRVYFQKNWNNTIISKIVLHKLSSFDAKTPICSQFQGNQEQLILLIVDGFGYCQYLWHSLLGEDDRPCTYNVNLFRWLEQEGCLRAFPVGSSYITDTAAGLSQIFTGRTARETGVISSKYYDRNSGNHFTETKRIPSQTFNKTFDMQYNCIFDVLEAVGIESKMFYCSRFPKEASGFSKSIFGRTNVVEVTPSERVFAVLKDEIDSGCTAGMQVVYNTGIDNSGHTMGAYSIFERYEHDKIDGLLRNFLVELAKTTPELFDGRRSILITSDHGMAESAKIMIDRFSISRVLTASGSSDARIIENNRSLLIYNISEYEINNAKLALTDFFESQDIKSDIITCTDSVYNDFFCTDPSMKQSQISPQIVVRLIGDGLFYSNTRANPHLLHYGGHGGASADEVFVPVIDIPLDQNLLNKLKSRFVDI